MDIEHVTPLSEKLEQELDSARREALAQQKTIEPTEEEKKNGWTAKTLTAYLAERLASQSLNISVDSLQRRNARKPQEANHRYRPHRWRE